MLSFLPRILNLIFAPSPVLVVSPSSPLFNDDKLNLSLPLPSSPSTALDQLRFVQHKFQIETLSCTSILSDEKQVKESWIGLISRKKEEKKRRSTRGLKVEARRVESPSPLPKAPVEVVLSQRLQNEIDELIKASRWEEESDFDLEEEVERRRRERSQGVARASLPEQAAKKGLNWVEQGRAVEELRLASRFEVDDDDEEEELQPVVVEKEEEKVDVEVVEELDEEQLRLARIVIVEAAAAGKAWWRGVVEKKMHRADTLAILTGAPHRSTGIERIEDRGLYNFIADNLKQLRLPESRIPGLWEEGEQEEEERMRKFRAARRKRIEVI